MEIVGGNTSGSTAFVNSALRPTSPNPTGNMHLVTTQSRFGGSCGDLTNDAIFFNPQDCEIGTQDFTMEGGIYPTSVGTTAARIFGHFDGTDGTSRFLVATSQGDGSVLSLYVDGALDYSNNSRPSFFGTNPYQLWIGSDRNDVEFMPGYLDEVRITNGLARYVASFTPPIAPLPGVNRN